MPAALSPFDAWAILANGEHIPQLINSVVQIVFFVTPIMWKPERSRAGEGFQFRR
jgi:lipopolysaccharide transport system permease protein